MGTLCVGDRRQKDKKIKDKFEAPSRSAQSTIVLEICDFPQILDFSVLGDLESIPRVNVR